MRKNFITEIPAGLVLLFGLTSCSQEQKSVDHYSPTVPHVKTVGKDIPLDRWMELKERALDLRDSLDFSESHPAQIQTQVQCRCQNDTFNRLSSFARVDLVRVFQTLPENLLIYDLKKRLFTCDFEMTLTNEFGSKHVYIFSFAELTDMLSSPVVVARDSIAELGNSIFNLNALDSVRIRYPNHEPMAVNLLCENFSTLNRPFDAVFDMAHFDFRSALESTRSHPDQLCRAKLMQNETQNEVSGLFTLRFPRPELGRVPSPNLYGDLSNVRPRMFVFEQTLRAHPLLLKTWRLINRENQIRRLRIPNTTIGAHIELFDRKLPVTEGHYLKFAYDKPWIRTEIAPDAALPLVQHDGFTHFALQPQQSVDVHFYFQAPSRIVTDDFKIEGVIEPAGALTLDEVDENGVVFDSFSLTLESAYYFTDIDWVNRQRASHAKALFAWP